MKVTVWLDLDIDDAVITDRMFKARTRVMPRAETVAMSLICERLADVSSVERINLGEKR